MSTHNEDTLTLAPAHMQPDHTQPAFEVLALTVPQAAHALQVSERHVWQLIADGTLETFSMGRATRVWIDDLKAMILRLRSAKATA